MTAAAAVPTDEQWREQALCAQADTGDVFFPEKGSSTADAKAICRRCPVTTDCLEYALANDERFGVWGGLSERERRRLVGEAHVDAQPDVDDSEPETDVCGDDRGTTRGYRRHIAQKQTAPKPARRRKTQLERDLIAQGYSAEFAARRAGVA